MKKNTCKAMTVKAKTIPPATPETEPFSDDQQDKFQELEDQIEQNILSGYKLAAALAQIRDEKLYRINGYKTFEDYCKERWDYSRSYCQRLADMNSVLTDLKEYEDSDVYPRNELQARVFVPLNKEQRVKLLEAVLKESDKDSLSASEFIKFRKQHFPDSYPATPTKPKNNDAIIDVKATVVTSKTMPSLIKAVESAEAALKNLGTQKGKQEAWVENLRDFIKEAQPVVKWEKENNK